jgi:hypothetical protein
LDPGAIDTGHHSNSHAIVVQKQDEEISLGKPLLPAEIHSTLIKVGCPLQIGFGGEQAPELFLLVDVDVFRRAIQHCRKVILLTEAQAAEDYGNETGDQNRNSRMIGLQNTWIVAPGKSVPATLRATSPGIIMSSP